MDYADLMEQLEAQAKAKLERKTRKRESVFQCGFTPKAIAQALTFLQGEIDPKYLMIEKIKKDINEFTPKSSFSHQILNNSSLDVKFKHPIDNIDENVISKIPLEHGPMYFPKSHFEVREEHIKKNKTLEDLVAFYQNPLNMYEHLEEIKSQRLDRPVALTRTQYTALSEEFAKKIAEIAMDITPEEIARTAELLKLGPLINAAMGLGEVLGDAGKNLTKQLRENTQRMMALYARTVSPDTEIGQAFDVSLAHAGTQIFNPEKMSAIDLNNMLKKAGACTHRDIQGFGTKQIQIDYDHTPAYAFAEDSRAGGSVHFLTKGKKGHSYGRMYLVVNHEGQVSAFYDAIESEDLGLSSIQGYLLQGKADRLIASMAASIIISNKLGLNELSFADYEMVEMSQWLGFGERKVFGEKSNLGEKLGYEASSHLSAGPYSWRLGSSKHCRTIDPGFYQQGIVDILIAQSALVMQRISEKPKCLKSGREEFGAYFGIVRHILSGIDEASSQRNVLDAIIEINDFCGKYQIEPEFTLPEITIEKTQEGIKVTSVSSDSYSGSVV